MNGPQWHALREGPTPPIGLFGGAGLVAAIVILVVFAFTPSSFLWKPMNVITS